MKIYDLVMQLCRALPLFTERFTDSVAVSSLTSAGTLATVVCSSAHNQVTGNSVTISGFANPVLIDTITRVGTVVTVVTLTEHDLTFGYSGDIVLSGSVESEFNGTFTLASVPNRNTFTFSSVDSGPLIATGSPQLDQNSGRYSYNGFYPITVINSTTFTYVLEKALGSPATNISGAVEVGYRITGAIDQQACIDIYTEKQDSKSWAYVINGDVTASKDRNNSTDAIYTYRAGSPAQYKQQLIQNFSVLIISPCKSYVTARPIRDEMEDLSLALFKSLVGAKLPTYIGPNAYYAIIFNTHNTLMYNKAIYVHEFQFQTVTDLTQMDIFNEDRSVAFRNINTIQSVDIMTENSERMLHSINLDEE